MKELLPICPLDNSSCNDPQCRAVGCLEQFKKRNTVAVMAQKPERDYTRFYTLPETAELMVTLAGLQPGMTVLEPHAGAGAIIAAIRAAFGRSVYIHACEINRRETHNISHYEPDVQMIGDFLKIPLKSFCYDAIIANPPFGNETDLDTHFIKMYNLLVNGGILVAILPKDYVFSSVIRYQELYCVPLDNWGTNKDGTVTPIEIMSLIK